MWNRPNETMDREALRSLQLERLQKTIHRVYQNVASYREKMQQKGLLPGDVKSLEDLRHLPFTIKDDLRDNYPFGLFAAPMGDIVRIHASSGTTGKPTVVGYTQNDINYWSECVARSLGCAGGERGDVVQIAYGYGLFTGGLGLHYGAEHMGATVVPVSGGNTQRQIMLMQDFGATILACTPSYAILMGETMREMGIDRSALKIRAGIFGAEPWTEQMRQRLEELWGIVALDIYGLSEIMGPGVAMECMEAKNGLHIWEDHFLPEIIDPDTEEVLPDGQMGELVITTITKEGLPIVRYKTHDITCIIPEPCVCGRTHRRIQRMRGRTDDMLIIRGVNVFPSQVETVLMNVRGVASHYQLVVDRINNLDTLEVQVELMPELMGDRVSEIEGLQRELAHRIASALGVNATVRLVEPKTIQRSEGKSKRIIDNRKLY